MVAQAVCSPQFDSWISSLQSVCGRFESHPALSYGLFIGEIARQDFSGLEVAKIRTNAGVISRHRTSIDQDEGRHCFLIVQRSGRAQLRQNGESVELAPGEMALMDSARDCEILPHGLIEHASFHLSREDVCRHMPDGRPKFGKLSQHCTSGRILRILVEQICGGELNNCADMEEGGAVQEALIALLAPTLRQRPGQAVSESDGSHNTGLRKLAQQLIDQSLSEPGLTPLILAQQLNISVRHLYRLFEEQGDSVCRFIQRARLKRSAADLSNPGLRNESITDIAFRWGFVDSAHFSRTFKKHFEYSPREYRAKAMAG